MDLVSLQKFKRCGKKKKRIISSDSEDDTIKSSQHSLHYEENIPSVENMESALVELIDKFPEKDELELQDALYSHNWNVSEVINMFSDKVTKRKRARLLSSSSDEENVKPNKSPVLERKSSKLSKPFKAKFTDEVEDEPDFIDSESKVYDSDDSDFELSNNMNIAQREVFDLLSNGLKQELCCMKNCSDKKIEALFQLRPFVSWCDLVIKLKEHKFLTTDLLNSAQEFINMRKVVQNLMKKCENISSKLETNVNALLHGKNKGALTEQPKCIPPSLQLSSYQMIGLNWLILLHKEKINGVLADEMGLGKTVQAIAFLAHLYDTGNKGPHVIVVPSSTLDNWQRELSKWCPRLKVIPYCGSQDDRMYCRNYRLLKEEFNVILTTYNLVSSSPKDRKVFRKLAFCYCIFDEAHLLKNAASQRYRQLMKINAKHKILLTGTPMQNNLIELMSLLTFMMPSMFGDVQQQLVPTFSLFPNSGDKTKGKFEHDRLHQAKNIIKPFFLRREKKEVLKDLPRKEDCVEVCPMISYQRKVYDEALKNAKHQCDDASNQNNKNVLMTLRKIANHPLLVLSRYTKDQLQEISKYLAKSSDYKDNDANLILEDLMYNSDFEIHSLVYNYPPLSHMMLDTQILLESGKFKYLKEILPDMKQQGDRVLIFSQFLNILDLLEILLNQHNMRFCRLDGSTPVAERQKLIDDYNCDDDLFVFLLSTKAGGLGINLTSANVVIIHDIDFNPYNDKQAEDRCHRVGQTRPVKVIRLLSEDTVEEVMYDVAKQKLKLEKDITSADDEALDVALLLQKAISKKS